MQVFKATAAAVTLGTGASLGPEGPSVEIGTAAARVLGGVLRSKRKHYISLIAAGSGAGARAVISRAYPCTPAPTLPADAIFNL